MAKLFMAILSCLKLSKAIERLKLAKSCPREKVLALVDLKIWNMILKRCLKFVWSASWFL